MEVAQMVEWGKPILPIFYGVEPWVVKHQKGKYGESFIKHKRRRDAETIRKWKNALTHIAGISGFVLKDIDNGYHGLLKRVVSRLWQDLRMDEQEGTENLVGIDRDVPEMMRKLGVDYQEEQVVKGLKTMESCVMAIWGLLGVGKTTLAKVVYNKIGHLFHSCSFLEDVEDEIKQNGMVHLQMKLYRDLKGGDCPEVKSYGEGTKMIKFQFKTKRILIVLDDVDDFEQIKPLAEKLCWFGQGSRIILTCRSKDVTVHYNVKKLENMRLNPWIKIMLLNFFISMLLDRIIPQRTTVICQAKSYLQLESFLLLLKGWGNICIRREKKKKYGKRLCKKLEREPKKKSETSIDRKL
ncbi:hypothetical protein BT93_L5646 [Corymbia citriodora subsp. variegata]|uniref:Uncharacterized protein n=1 Tax=Corymbia citriodora subsp. variegata TaxID=360336 RepID=A0A8T0CRS0_CORYI|nr:hypothetical protein BT93_L5646 [Corymbia citriodora subsp. variegata]